MLYGITKIRNEELIIKDTLDNWSQWVDEFYIVDEMSEDQTVEICKAHPKVKEVFIKSYFDEDRERAEWVNRQLALKMAQKNATQDDWFVYFDADERLYDFDGVLEGDVIACKLFDIYITPEDIDKPYYEREWIGPEYRLIPFFFKNSQYLSYSIPDQRNVTTAPDAKIIIKGSIKHYGKGISVKHWENTCDYYMQWPKYREKWEARRGKAIHTKSDFNNKLIRWEARNTGFPLQE
jgi:glycosyltransferase involved in cell wall biosynthesis